MQSHLSRERVAVEARASLVEGAASDLRRLESERAIFVRQLELLRGQAAEEEAEFARVAAKVAAVRAELARLREAEAEAVAGQARARASTSEARGVLAALAHVRRGAG